MWPLYPIKILHIFQKVSFSDFRNIFFYIKKNLVLIKGFKHIEYLFGCFMKHNNNCYNSKFLYHNYFLYI